MKRLILACLLLALALPGWAAAQDAPMGRYVEEARVVPGAGDMAFAQADGATYAVDCDGQFLYTSADLVNWETGETGHDEARSPAKGGVYRLAVGQGGALYLAGWAMKDEAGYPYVERIVQGQSETVTLQKKLYTGEDTITFCVLDSGDLMGLSQEAVYRFSPQGAIVQTYQVPGGSAMAAYQNLLAVCVPDSGEIKILDVETGRELRTLQLPGAQHECLIAFDRVGALYCAGRDGIYRVNAGGTLMVQIVDGRLATLGKPSARLRQLLFDREGNPVIACADDALSLIAYRYDESVTTEPTGTLTVFALYPSDALSQCATLFQQQNPSVLVDIQVALHEGAATRDDAIRALNTRLLSGNGPDVLVLDGLPVNSYMEKGVLQDLTSVVEPMVQSGQLSANLARAFAADGAIPAVPTRLLLPLMWGDVAGIRAIDDLAAWAAAHPGALPYYALDVDSLIATFYPTCAPAWLDGDRLDAGKVEEFLTCMQAIRGDWTYEKGVEATGLDVKAAMQSIGYSMPDWNPYSRSGSLSASLVEDQGAFAMMRGLQRHLSYLVAGADSLAVANGMAYPTDFAPLPGQVEGGYLPALMLGAGKGAKVDWALKFIACALSYDIQRGDMGEGFPVNARALDEMQRRDEDTVTGGGGDPELGTDWHTQWPDQAGRDQLRSIIDGLHTPVVVDFTLYQMTVDGCTPFFQGAMDASQAARNLCAKVNAYLSE